MGNLSPFLANFKFKGLRWAGIGGGSAFRMLTGKPAIVVGRTILLHQCL